MSDIKALLAAARRLRQQGEPALLATVVRVQGSSYRRPGARMLLSQEAWLAGSVSGGCLEGDVIKKGWWRSREGRALVTYDARTQSEELRSGFGLGCDGVVDVLLERVDPTAGDDALALWARCVAAQERCCLCTIFRSTTAVVPLGARLWLGPGGEVQAQGLDEDAALRANLLAAARAVLRGGKTEVRALTTASGAYEALVEVLQPPPRLFLFGAGHDAVPLMQMALVLGWEVIVCDAGARLSTRERFAQADEILFAPLAACAARVDESLAAVAVVMAHSYERDRDCLEMLLRTRARYLGVLGPRRRTERMLAEMDPACAALGNDPRLHAPMGLALGAESPSEIALAVLAEAQAALREAPAVPLRERAGASRALPRGSTSYEAERSAS